MKKHPLLSILPWGLRLLGVGVFVYLMQRVGVGTVTRLIAQMGPLAFMAVLALNLPHIGMKAARWHLLMKKSGPFPYVASLHAYFSGIAMGIVTPGRAGEFFRALYPVKAGAVEGAASLAYVLADRLYDLALLLTLSMVATLTFVHPSYAAGGVVSAALVFVLLRRHSSLVDRVLRRVSGKFKAGEHHYDAFRAALLSSFKRPLVPIGLTMTGYLVLAAQVFWIAHAMGVRIGFWELLLYFSLANTVALLPISLSGLGTREAALGFIFVLSGRPEQEGIAIALAFFLLMAVPVTLLGSVALLFPSRWFLRRGPHRR